MRTRVLRRIFPQCSTISFVIYKLPCTRNGGEAGRATGSTLSQLSFVLDLVLFPPYPTNQNGEWRSRRLFIYFHYIHFPPEIRVVHAGSQAE